MATFTAVKLAEMAIMIVACKEDGGGSERDEVSINGYIFFLPSRVFRNIGISTND